MQKLSQKFKKTKGDVKGAWDKDIMTDFIRENNRDETKFHEAVKNFFLSSIGYAVSTCVLGIADRHPSNVMVQKDGHYFHIDFGHFLGNFKTKFNIKREDAPFHYSPACYTVVENSRVEFEQYCGRAYNELRHNSGILFTALSLMVGTGIPELRTLSDLEYMKNMLSLKMTDEQAASFFSDMIRKSLESTKTLMNNIIHNMAHN